MSTSTVIIIVGGVAVLGYFAVRSFQQQTNTLAQAFNKGTKIDVTAGGGSGGWSSFLGSAGGALLSGVLNSQKQEQSGAGSLLR